MRTSLIIDLAGNLAARAQQYGRALEGMASRGQRAMGLLKGSSALVGKGLDALGNKYSTALGAIGGGMAVKNVMDLQMRMTRLGITADAADSEIAKLKQTIYEAAQAPDIRVDPSQIIGAVEAIMEKTGDLKFTTDNIRNIGIAIQATGAEGAAVGEIFAEFQKQGIASSQEVLETIAILNNQGKAGAFTLQNLASLGPRVVTAYTSMGRSGKEAMREMGAVLQVIRQGTGSSEQATTAWEALMRTFSDTNKLKILQKNGIKVFDEKALKKGQEILRPAPDLLKEILLAAKGKKTNLSEVFDAEALKAFSSITGELIRTGKIDSLDQFMAVDGDPSSLLKDASRAADTATSAMQNLHSAWGQFADTKLTEPIQKAADLLNKLGSEDSQKLLNYAANAGMVVGGAVVAKKAYTGGRAVVGGVRSLFGRGGGNADSAAGAAAGLSLPNPLPVFVTNIGALAGGRGAGGGNSGSDTNRGSGTGSANRGRTAGAGAGRRTAPSAGRGASGPGRRAPAPRTGRGRGLGGVLAAGAGLALDFASGDMDAGELASEVLGSAADLTSPPSTAAAGGRAPTPRPAPRPAGGVGRAGSLASKAGSVAGRAGGVLAAGAAIYEGAQILTDDSLTTAEKVEGVSGAAGAAAGGAGGAALGAAIGTAILPGVGTAIGALLGGYLGSEGGREMGKAVGGLVNEAMDGLGEATEKVSGWFSSLWSDDEKPQEKAKEAVQKSKSEVVIRVDGPATVQSATTTDGDALDVYSGKYAMPY